jgi:hypothetical protein
MKDAASVARDLAIAVREFEQALLVHSQTEPGWKADTLLHPALTELKRQVDLLRHTLRYHLEQLPRPVQECVTEGASPRSFFERVDEMILPQLNAKNDKSAA